MELRVLYEDNHLIVVYKPAGVLVQGDETGDVCLMDQVKEYLKEKYHKPGKVFLGLVHRLDRPVSGIVVFAKTSKGAARLSEQIRSRTFKKTYYALVWGIPTKTSGTLINFLKKDEARNVVAVYDEAEPGALRAELDYEVKEIVGDKSILKINLKTGRPHQIRAQLSAFGHPIVGDVKYALPAEARRAKAGHHDIALCATAVEFKLATVDEIKKLEINIPKDWKKL